MEPVKLIKQVGNALAISLCLFVVVWIFFLYQIDTTLGQKLAYAFIYIVSIWFFIAVVQWTIIWVVEALQKPKQ